MSKKGRGLRGKKLHFPAGGPPLIGSPRPPTENEQKIQFINQRLGQMAGHCIEYTMRMLQAKVAHHGD